MTYDYLSHSRTLQCKLQRSAIEHEIRNCTVDIRLSIKDFCRCFGDEIKMCINSGYNTAIRGARNTCSARSVKLTVHVLSVITCTGHVLAAGGCDDHQNVLRCRPLYASKGDQHDEENQTLRQWVVTVSRLRWNGNRTCNITLLN